jgi:hypothetical protein
MLRTGWVVADPAVHFTGRFTRGHVVGDGPELLRPAAGVLDFP